MMNSKDLFDEFVSRIDLPESKDEMASMAYLIFEHFFRLSKTNLLSEKVIRWNDEDGNLLENILMRINKSEPVQYIIGEAEFYGRKFKVNSAVLIPRPETEELVRVVLKEVANVFSFHKNVRVLDIGTGSGCIPVTIKLELPDAEVFATDISDQALLVAEGNAKALNANTTFFRHNILDEALPFKNLDVIVSNPPYISVREKKNMKSNVVQFEPHVALFVPDEDPLIFYKAIATRALSVLNKRGGFLTMEINERYGSDVAFVLREKGFEKVEVIKDISGKDRIVIGRM